MGVPREAPQAVHDYWAKVPNCADIKLRFWIFGIIPIWVSPEAWGQLANDYAAQRCADSILSRWGWCLVYQGWKEVGGERFGWPVLPQERDKFF